MTDDMMEIYPNAVRSFGDVSGEALQSDFSLIFGGFLLMFSYTVLMLGRINKVEIRILLTVIGLISILMGIIIGMGLREGDISKHNDIFCNPLKELFCQMYLLIRALK